MMNKLNGLVALSLLVYGRISAAANLGQIANATTSAEVGVARLIHAILIITGVGLLLGSLLKYRTYRINSSEVGVVEPVALLIVGLSLIGVAFIPIFT